MPCLSFGKDAAADFNARSAEAGRPRLVDCTERVLVRLLDSVFERTVGVLSSKLLQLANMPIAIAGATALTSRIFIQIQDRGLDFLKFKKTKLQLGGSF